MKDASTLLFEYGYTRHDIISMTKVLEDSPAVRRDLDQRINQAKAGLAEAEAAIEAAREEYILSGEYTAAGKNVDIREAWLNKKMKETFADEFKKKETWTASLETLVVTANEERRKAQAADRILGFLQSVLHYSA